MPEKKGATIEVPHEADLRREPWRFDWFEVMRWLEARNPKFPRFGEASLPSQEIVRVGQVPSLNFAPATLVGCERKHGRLNIGQMSFGLFGPNGPMPLFFTEFARERGDYDDDHALQAFLDLFHHRFSLMFYRAWASVQPTVSLDRAGEDDYFSRYVGSLIGHGEAVVEGRDAVPGHAKRYMAGHMARLTRNPEGLVSILRVFFACAFRVQEWMPQWLRLENSERTFLGADTAASQLGRGAVCGASVLDRRHRFRIHAGPLTFAQYMAFLPGYRFFQQLRDWVRNYIGFEFSWDLRLILRREDVPTQRLGANSGMLGWTTWLGRANGEDRGDLVLQGERAVRPAVAPSA